MGEAIAFVNVRVVKRPRSVKTNPGPDWCFSRGRIDRGPVRGGDRRSESHTQSRKTREMSTNTQTKRHKRCYEGGARNKMMTKWPLDKKKIQKETHRSKKEKKHPQWHKYLHRSKQQQIDTKQPQIETQLPVKSANTTGSERRVSVPRGSSPHTRVWIKVYSDVLCLLLLFTFLLMQTL